jgi:hypothetical protein
LHDTDAGFPVTVLNGALDWRSPAPSGQQGSVYVPAPKPGYLKYFSGEDQAVSDYDHQVCRQPFEYFPDLARFQSRGLMNRDAGLDRKLFNRAGKYSPATAGRPVRLGQDSYRRAFPVNELPQGRYGKFGRPGKQDS